jgi:anaerobic C4-dicarboxylate transporter
MLGPNPASTVLIFLFVAAVIVAIVVVARYVSTKRKRLEEALILQARLSDAILREAPLRDVAVTPRARVAVWRGSPVTIEVAGEVPTPELRDTVLRLVRTELSLVRPDVPAEDHLWIVPPMSRAS